MCTEVSVASCDFHKHFVKQQIKWILKKKKKKVDIIVPVSQGPREEKGFPQDQSWRDQSLPPSTRTSPRGLGRRAEFKEGEKGIPIPIT